ncbi:MAG: hypothetical protein QOG12_974 [Verrucomicrobiota bacterium]|jgi:hypothetical protein
MLSAKCPTCYQKRSTSWSMRELEIFGVVRSRRTFSFPNSVWERTGLRNSVSRTGNRVARDLSLPKRSLGTRPGTTLKKIVILIPQSGRRISDYFSARWRWKPEMIRDSSPALRDQNDNAGYELAYRCASSCLILVPKLCLGTRDLVTRKGAFQTAHLLTAVCKPPLLVTRAPSSSRFQ